jgi:hypothetical protein
MADYLTPPTYFGFTYGVPILELGAKLDKFRSEAKAGRIAQPQRDAIAGPATGREA